jgi:hypothetical protein
MAKSIVLVLYLALASAGCGLAGAGGDDQIVPDTVKADEPAVVTIVFSVWGAGGPIKNRYKDIAFYYHLSGEPSFRSLPPEPTAVPYKQYDKDRFVAFKFTIPGYAPGSTGEIEFYYECTFDGHRSRQNGVKKIRVVSDPTPDH